MTRAPGGGPDSSGASPLADLLAAIRRDAERARAEWAKTKWAESRWAKTEWAPRVEPVVAEAERRARELPRTVRSWSEARAYERSERRLRAAPYRARRRANLQAGAWGALAAASPVVAVANGPWEWFAVAAGAAVRSGLAWRDARQADRRAWALALPEPSMPIPRSPRLRGSAATRPLQRSEQAWRALVTMTRSVPPGPTHDSLRAAMGPAAGVVDGLRAQAGRVIAVEAARDAVADRSRRAEIAATIGSVVAEMEAALAALEAMLAAASDVVAAMPAGVDDRLRLLGWRTDALRGYAEGLRAATTAASGDYR
jgi:hypothetical protein